jgi:hypothetical protein
MADQPAVRLGPWPGQPENAAALVIAVGPEVLDRAPGCRVGAGAAVSTSDVVRRAAQIIGRVVGPEIGTVAEHRAILHEAVVEKNLLPALDVALRVEQLACGTDDAVGNRRLGLVCTVGEQAEHEEPSEHDEDDGLHPSPGHE